MAFDGLVLAAMARELSAALAGGRVDKIQQPTDDDIIMTIRANRINHRLVLSANKTYPRAHLGHSPALPGPPVAPMFCMLLRKHLEGGRIAAVTQWKRERILFVDVDARDELGDRALRRLVLEIMGRHSNLLLLDRPDGTILEATSHTPRSINRHREVLPGRPYVYPPAQDKTDPFAETAKGFAARRAQYPDSPVQQFVVDHYLGVSPFFGKEIAAELRLETAGDSPATGATAALEWIVFADMLQRAKEATWPTIVQDGGQQPKAFYLFAPVHVSGRLATFPSVSACVDTFFRERALADIARSKTSGYTHLIRNELERTRQKADKFAALLDAEANAETWRVMGELLTAYPHEVKKGQTRVVLPNFYDQETPLSIDLDPARTALENANSYFKRYNKYKRGRDKTLEQLGAARADILYLESVLHELESCALADLPQIETELRDAGYLKRAPDARSQRGKKPEPVRHAIFRAQDGTPIFVGRNNRENDQLTLRVARKTDLWLHVKDAPGSHVIIASPDPTQDTIFDAAMLAAYFSKLRDSAKAAVDVVPVKQIWQPNSARPGFVLFEGQQTLMVRLDAERIRSLLGTAQETKQAGRR
ncbi:MAG: Rqc2 family fibronectin-binding protein [Bacilli bacterium]